MATVNEPVEPQQNIETPLIAHSPKVAVVIPCYRVKQHIMGVLASIPPVADVIFCIDDACPDGSGQHIADNCRDARVQVITHENNLGVGGSVKTGYRAAIEAGCDIALKIDGDGQMDPDLVPGFLQLITSGKCDYSKGNRFFRIEDVRQMPGLRIFGNAVLSFFAKLSTGYWNIFDPTNGYTALHLSVLDLVDLEKVSDRYFFETDLLFRLNIAKCVVREVPMAAKYGQERSGLSETGAILPFVAGHLKNFFKRIFYSYFLRDFHVASVQILLGPLLLFAGILFGGYHWMQSINTGETATAGTVMIAAVLILTGLQLNLSALSYDMNNVPRDAIHPNLAGSTDT